MIWGNGWQVCLAQMISKILSKIVKHINFPIRSDLSSKNHSLAFFDPCKMTKYLQDSIIILHNKWSVDGLVNPSHEMETVNHIPLKMIATILTVDTNDSLHLSIILLIQSTFKNKNACNFYRDSQFNFPNIKILYQTPPNMRPPDSITKLYLPLKHAKINFIHRQLKLRIKYTQIV